MASPEEKFVDMPGIVEIQWNSHDSDLYRGPMDLFEEQKFGLSHALGNAKKDLARAWFTCKVCDCDLKGVVSLRAHCKASQHVRNVLQKKKECRANR